MNANIMKIEENPHFNNHLIIVLDVRCPSIYDSARHIPEYVKNYIDQRYQYDNIHLGPCEISQKAAPELAPHEVENDY